MDWLALSEALAVVVLIALAVPVILLYSRRRWLSRQGGMFDCNLRLSSSTPGTGWVLGVARYEGEYLEWFRAVSLSFRPRVRFERRTTAVVGQRVPEPAERLVLYHDQSVVILEERAGRQVVRELAMSPESATGLLSWLEAAPPGLGGYQAPRFDRPSGGQPTP